PEHVTRRLLEALVASRTIGDHIAAVTRRHALLPVLTSEGVHWIPSDTAAGTPIVSVPDWTRAPSTVRALFTERLSGASENILFIDANAPRIGGHVSLWPLDWLNPLLDCITVDVLRTPEQLAWVDKLIGHVIASKAGGHDKRSNIVARWLANRIGE